MRAVSLIRIYATTPSKYKDKNEPHDASRDVALMNLQMEDLDERMKRNRAQERKEAGTVNENALRELRQQLSESQERERLKDVQIASLEQGLHQMKETEDKHHSELLAAISGSRNGSSVLKARPKIKSSAQKASNKT